MRRIVLDTNCLLAVLPKRSPYHNVWEAFLAGEFVLCITTDILNEYEEIIAAKTSGSIASNVIRAIIQRHNVCRVEVYYRFNLITQDPDDNKFVDCALSAGAEFLVSEDKHFNILRHITFPYIHLIRLHDFSQTL